jgi:hypothetical protein
VLFSSLLLSSYEKKKKRRGNIIKKIQSSQILTDKLLKNSSTIIKQIQYSIF